MSMRIRLAVPDAAVRPEVLDAALEAVTRTNERLIDEGMVPTAEQAIAKGVKWKPEPPGDEHFDHAQTVVKRGWGDCDDLAPYHAASLRVTGEDPGARAFVKRSGPNRWHAMVERSDGSVDDPSADAGMYEYRSPVQAKLAGAIGVPHIATKKVGPLWCARCDAPWKKSRYAISGHSVAHTQRAAASGAIRGAMIVGDSAGIVEEEHIVRLCGLDALVTGCNPGEVRGMLESMGIENPGVVLGRLMKTAANIRGDNAQDFSRIAGRTHC
jgi:hypothetical protein